jgi:hypothetical protein
MRRFHTPSPPDSRIVIERQELGELPVPSNPKERARILRQMNYQDNDLLFLPKGENYYDYLVRERFDDAQFEHFMRKHGLLDKKPPMEKLVKAELWIDNTIPFYFGLLPKVFSPKDQSGLCFPEKGLRGTWLCCRQDQDSEGCWIPTTKDQEEGLLIEPYRLEWLASNAVVASSDDILRMTKSGTAFQSLDLHEEIQAFLRKHKEHLFQNIRNKDHPLIVRLVNLVNQFNREQGLGCSGKGPSSAVKIEEKKEVKPAPQPKPKPKVVVKVKPKDNPPPPPKIVPPKDAPKEQPKGKPKKKKTRLIPRDQSIYAIISQQVNKIRILNKGSNNFDKQFIPVLQEAAAFLKTYSKVKELTYEQNDVGIGISNSLENVSKELQLLQTRIEDKVKNFAWKEILVPTVISYDYEKYADRVASVVADESIIIDDTIRAENGFPIYDNNLQPLVDAIIRLKRRNFKNEAERMQKFYYDRQTRIVLIDTESINQIFGPIDANPDKRPRVTNAIFHWENNSCAFDTFLSVLFKVTNLPLGNYIRNVKSIRVPDAIGEFSASTVKKFHELLCLDIMKLELEEVVNIDGCTIKPNWTALFPEYDGLAFRDYSNDARTLILMLLDLYETKANRICDTGEIEADYQDEGYPMVFLSSSDENVRDFSGQIAKVLSQGYVLISCVIQQPGHYLSQVFDPRTKRWLVVDELNNRNNAPRDELTPEEIQARYAQSGDLRPMGWLFAKKAILQMDETVVISREKPSFIEAWQDKASLSRSVQKVLDEIAQRKTDDDLTSLRIKLIKKAFKK